MTSTPTTEERSHVPKLIYSFLASLHGYIADDAGGFEWAVPDEEVLEFINALERDVGIYLYGRNMYEMMTGWEDDPTVAGQSPKSAEFAQVWQAAERSSSPAAWRRCPRSARGSSAASIPARSRDQGQCNSRPERLRRRCGGLGLARRPDR